MEPSNTDSSGDTTKGTALVILDMQNDFFNHSGYHVSIRDSLAENINSLIRTAREKEIPIIWVGRGFDEIPAQFASFLPTSVVCKNPGKAIDELDYETNDKTIERTRDNAFYKTGLDEHLKKTGINTLIIVGLYTHTSVMKTASAAKNSGYDPIIAQECVASNDKQCHDAAMGAMRINKIDIKTKNSLENILIRQKPKASPSS